MTLQIAFRADSGLHIGNGHLMRCLTLADAMTAHGAQCHMLMRPNDGHLGDLIRERGHQVQLLEDQTAPYGTHPAPPAHAGWLGTSWQADAHSCRTIIEAIGCDWLVLDHYALDSAWQAEARPDGCRLMVIDDLADRPHLADILLDQNLGHEPSDYVGLVPHGALIFTGPSYALLRPDFGRLRETALARRKKAKIQNLLISLGGIDKDNVTMDVLKALCSINLPKDMEITVVMGPTAPALGTVRQQAAQMPRKTTVLCGVSNMAEIMTTADLCIGAAGGSAWERAALGLPTLLIVLAENQRSGAWALLETGAAVELLLGKALPKTLQEQLSALQSDSKAYLAMVNAAASKADGHGVAQLAKWLHCAPISLRDAQAEDAEFIWRCRHDGEAWKYYKSAAPVPLSSHRKWFENALKNPRLDLLIASSSLPGRTQLQDIGYIRFDHNAITRSAEISLSLAGEARGHGLGRGIIATGLRKAASLGVQDLKAIVHLDNAASRQAFIVCGFQPIEKEGSFMTLTRQVILQNY